MPRTFIGIKIPNEISEKIIRFLKEKSISRLPNLKTVEQENLHITLKFLGEVEEEKIQEIIEDLSSISFSIFKVEVKNIGVFPSVDYPRVIWIGAISSEIYELKKILDRTLKKLKFEEEKNFISHITICRVKNGNPSAKIKELMKENISFGEFFVNEFTLFESVLTPSGPIYKNIKEFKLKAKT